MFYPFYNNSFRTINSFGIPVLRTIYVSADTTNNTVTYGLCPKIWRQLPNEGMFILKITNTPPSTVAATSVVYIDPCKYVSQVSASSTTSVTAHQLLNGSGSTIPTSEITNGNRYLVYYNKCNGVFQVINNIVAASPAA